MTNVPWQCRNAKLLATYTSSGCPAIRSRRHDIHLLVIGLRCSSFTFDAVFCQQVITDSIHTHSFRCLALTPAMSQTPVGLLLIIIILVSLGTDVVYGDLKISFEGCYEGRSEGRIYISKELICLAKENTFDEIVQHIGKRAEDGRDFAVCRRPDNHMPDDYENYRMERQPISQTFCHNDEEQKEDRPGYFCRHKDEDTLTSDPRAPCEACICPRNILTDVPSLDEDGNPSGITGVLRSCPESDPDYLECLCMSGVRNEDLNTFARSFKRPEAGYKQQRCPGDRGDRGDRTTFGGLLSWLPLNKREVKPSQKVMIIGDEVCDPYMLRLC